MVRVNAPATKVGRKKKMRNDLWKGPVVITRVGDKGNVKIEIDGKRKWVHSNRIKPAEIGRSISDDHISPNLNSLETSALVPVQADNGAPETIPIAAQRPFTVTRAGRISRQPERLGI